MGRSWLLSSLLHGALAVLLWFGLPSLSRPLPAIESGITVELVSEADLRPPAPDVAAAAPAPAREAARPEPSPPARKPEPVAEPEPAPEPEPVIAEPEPQPEPEPEPVIAEPEPAHEPEPEPVIAEPEPVPEPEPAPKVAVAEPEPAPAPAPEPQSEAVPEPEPEPEQRQAALQPEPPELAPARPQPPAATPRPQVKPAPPPPPQQPAKVEPPKPEPPKATPAMAPKREPEPEKPEPPEEDEFAALLRSVEDMERRSQDDIRREGTGRDGTAAGQARTAIGDAGLSSSEIDALRRQIGGCWSLPVGIDGIEDMVVRLRIQVRPDRIVYGVAIEDQGRLNRDPKFRAVAESARRAVEGCSPLNLPPDKYGLWRDIVMNFYPADAISG
jgi:hypothetical protein